MSADVFGRVDARPREKLDRDEVYLATFVLSYVVMAAATWPQRFLSLFQLYLENGIIPIALIAVVGFSMLALIRERKHPLRFIRSFLSERIFRGATIVLLFLAGLSAFTTYKIAIPEIVPFYADDYLASFGRWLNEDGAWKLAHQSIPDWLGVVIVTSYGKIWLFHWMAVVTFAAFCADREKSFRYFLALALTVVLCGTFLATAMSSVGPMYYDHFYGGSRYHELHELLSSNPTLRPILDSANYLLTASDNHRADLGSGISAAPSMHVAVACLGALFLGSFNRWLGVAGWLYASIIMLGSVYTGWHYVLDGMISVVAVAVIWWCAGRAGMPNRVEMPRAIENQSTA